MRGVGKVSYEYQSFFVGGGLCHISGGAPFVQHLLNGVFNRTVNFRHLGPGIDYFEVFSKGTRNLIINVNHQ